MATRTYEFQMTAETATAAIAPLERALWEHNQRMYEAMAPGRRILRWIGLACCVAGLLLVTPFLLRHFDWMLAGAALAMTGFFALFIFLPELDPRMRLTARRAVARAARKTVAPVIARAPYTIAYELGEGRIRTQARQLGIQYELAFRGLKLAIVSDPIVCIFRGRYWPTPSRVFYAPTADELAALCEELRSAGVDVVVAR